ncbi:hypothetical protein ACFVAD_01025 [Sutcliffiella sp. NPDC057660]|uniref:hypothetical protein n=1 Tax=Sutcliffiella sp. NPDC057660 TaxID=3346199 RepID=UPI0036A8AD96
MEKQLKSLTKELDQILLKNITLSSNEKNKILQGIHEKRRKRPIAYYSALVVAAALVCLFTFSQLDFMKIAPGMSDKEPPIVEPQEEEPDELPEVEKETPDVPEEDENDYSTSPTFYMDEAGVFKLKLWKDSEQGIGIGDSMERVLAIYGEPAERFDNDVNPNSEIFKYRHETLDSLTIIFTEETEPKVESISAFYKFNPIDPLSFPSDWYGTILDLVSNLNVYGEKEILFFQKEDKFYNVKLLDKSKHQDETEMKEAYNATELTLEEYLERVIEKADEELTGEVADEDVPALVDYLMDNIIQTFHELGEEYDWDTHHGKLADFEILRPELREYASTNLTEGHLKYIKDEFYIGRDSTFLPSDGFDIRYTVLENTSNRIVISTIGLTGYIGNPETVYYTIIKEDGRWILDDWERVGVDQELLNVTFDEFKIYIDSWGNKLDFLHEVSHEGEKIFVFKASDYHQVEAVYASTSIFVPNDKILEEWIPEEYRKSETP